MKIRFKSKIHLDRYHEIMNRMRRDDVYHNAVAYLIALNDDCYKHASDVYDFLDNMIVIDGLSAAWQTSGSLRVTRLMFNLWNGYCYDNYDDMSICSDYTALSILYDTDSVYFFEAIKIRYPELFTDCNLQERTEEI